MEKHSKYSGSMFYRVPLCPGAAKLAATVPQFDDSTEYSRKGDLAHEFLNTAIERRSVEGLSFPSIEMRNAVADLVGFVEHLRQLHPDIVVLAEQRFFFPQNVVRAEDAGGTVDVFCYSAAAKQAWVIDFKYGVGELVYARDNWQLLFYAISICWDIAGLETISLTIFQPRAFNGASEPQEWIITPFDLVEYQAEAEAAIRAAEHPFAPLIPGDPQCHWCPAGPVCLARERLAIATIAEDGRPIREFTPHNLPRPLDMGADRIAYVLAFKDFLTAWLRDVESYAIALARGGTPIPGRKLVYATPRRRWNTAGHTEQQLAERIAAWGSLPLDDVFPRELLGITEMEKRLIASAKAAGATPAEAKDFMAWLTIRDTSGNVTLAPETDGRAEVVPARDNFGSVVDVPFNETPHFGAIATARTDAPIFPGAFSYDVPSIVGPSAGERPVLIPGVTTPHEDEYQMAIYR